MITNLWAALMDTSKTVKVVFDKKDIRNMIPLNGFIYMHIYVCNSTVMNGKALGRYLLRNIS